MIEKWIETWSYDDAVKLAKWNNLPPNIWFRVNNLSYTNLKFKNYLKENDIEFDIFDASNLFFLPKTGIVDILGSELFKKGLLSVQNPTSGLIVMLLDPKEDEVVIKTLGQIQFNLKEAIQLYETTMNQDKKKKKNKKKKKEQNYGSYGSQGLF